MPLTSRRDKTMVSCMTTKSLESSGYSFFERIGIFWFPIMTLMLMGSLSSRVLITSSNE